MQRADRFLEESQAQPDLLGDAATEGDLPVGELRGRLMREEDLLRFFAAGKAVLTVLGKFSGRRFTFKFSRPKEEQGKKRPIWAHLLSGPDNESSYEFSGTFWEIDGQGRGGTLPGQLYTYNHSAKSRLRHDAESVKALQWMARNMGSATHKLMRQAEFWHEGRCGRCARRLTVPSSVAAGFGPECAGRLH